MPLTVICGFSRSGTTLLYLLLKEHVQGVVFFDAEASALRLPPMTGPDVCTKRPHDILKLAEIRERHPDVRVVICIRDPRDILVSRHAKDPSVYAVSCDHSMFWDAEGKGTPTGPGLVETWRAFVHARKVATVIRYEDLTTDPKGVLRSLGRVCKWKHRVLADGWAPSPPEGLVEPLNGIGPVTTDRVGAYQRDLPRIREQMAQFPELTYILQHMGY